MSQLLSPLLSRAAEVGAQIDLQQHRHELYSLVGLALLVPVTRVVLNVLILKPWATRLLVSKAARETGKVPRKARRTVDKACESAWKLLAYCTLLALGWSALRDEPWLWSTRALWEGWPHAVLPRRVGAYYAAEAAFYTASCFTLFWEERRKDFAAMLVHHVATVALIVGSYHCRYGRIGAVVMLLHDPSDVFLEAAKLCSYAEWDGPASALFAGLLLSWLGLRLVALPFRLIWSAWFGVKEVLGFYPPTNTPFVLLLCLLVCLHLYWFSLIAGIAYQKLTTGQARDSRESEDD